jgi:hypothetical protein
MEGALALGSSKAPGMWVGWLVLVVDRDERDEEEDKEEDVEARGSHADGGCGPHEEGGRSASGPSKARRLAATWPRRAVSPEGSQ